MTRVITKGLLGIEDVNVGTGTFSRATSVGGSQTLHKIPLPASALGGLTLITAQGASGAITGTGADASLFTYTIPAAIIAAAKAIRITCGFTHGTGSALVTYKAKFGSTIISTISTAATGDLLYTATIYNNGSGLISKVDKLEGLTLLPTPAFASGLSVDFTASQAFAMTFNVASSDAVTPDILVIELIQ